MIIMHKSLTNPKVSPELQEVWRFMTETAHTTTPKMSLGQTVNEHRRDPHENINPKNPIAWFDNLKETLQEAEKKIRY